MNSRIIILIAICSVWFQPDAISQNKNLKDRATAIFELTATQYRNMMELLEDEEEFPRSFENGKMITSNSGWWCSGFYPGTLLNTFEETGDSTLYEEALLKLNELEDEQYNTTTHDLGFMMFCSFGKAHQMSPKQEYSQILINSAKSLASRFNPAVGCIKSWDSEPDNFLVIIDNMMNLELLFWATEETGDSSFYDIAVTHADNTLKNHFRADNSSYHVLNYHPETGKIQEKKTAQGMADESAWARGQAWGLYGYVVTYRETRDEKYLEQAEKIADFILNHPNLPEDKIPYWDFDAENNPETHRDASAAAIIASALLELKDHTKSEELASFYLDNAEKMLNTLSSETYLAKAGENGGFLIKHCVGHLLAKSEVDVPLTYADYYFIEALKRYKND